PRVYATGSGWRSEAGGMYQLAPASPGCAKGVKSANFNDGVATPDVGAHQSSTAAMKFGLAASAGSAVGGASGSAPPGTLANLSTRGQVLTGNDVMIGGFVIGGSTAKTVAIVATGPSLAAFGIANALANPTLTLVRSSDQSAIASNDNWQSAANAAQLQASGFAPTNPLDSAILVTLQPGAYTAIVSGAGGVIGVSTVEVFAL